MVVGFWKMRILLIIVSLIAIGFKSFSCLLEAVKG